MHGKYNNHVPGSKEVEDMNTEILTRTWRQNNIKKTFFTFVQREEVNHICSTFQGSFILEQKRIFLRSLSLLNVNVKLDSL